MPDGSFEPLVDADTLLGLCPVWPVLFSLPPRGEKLLEELSRYRIGVSDPSQTARPRAIFSALILELPEDPMTICALSNYSPAAGPPPAPGSMADALRRRRQVRLPAPLSLRLNRLIAYAGETTSQRCSRTAVVVSMMKIARQGDRQEWSARFAEVLMQRASRAVPGFDAGSPESVLRLRRPSPGPRPQIAAT